MSHISTFTSDLYEDQNANIYYASHFKIQKILFECESKCFLNVLKVTNTKLGVKTITPRNDFLDLVKKQIYVKEYIRKFFLYKLPLLFQQVSFV